MNPKVDFLGVIYSEFDNEVGPRLLYQHPPEIMSSKTFEILSDFIIIGKHLCEKIMIFKYDHQQIVNYSVAIDNAKYGRNTLAFAIGFIVEENVDSEPYEVVLRKIATTLIALELESEFLFCQASKGSLETVLKIIYTGLSTLGEAYVQFDQANLLSLKLYREPPNPPPLIHDYDVPILLIDKTILEKIPWDITAHRILPHINGQSCARKISLDAEVDLQCGKRCLRVLLFYQCILISDIFAFSNVYVTTSRVLGARSLPFLSLIPSLELSNPNHFSEIEPFCSINNSSFPSRENIFRFLLLLRPGISIGEIIAEYPKLIRNIDLSRLLGISQHLGLIQRVRKYPILNKDNNTQLKISQHFGMADSRSKLPPKSGHRPISSQSGQAQHEPDTAVTNQTTSCGPSTDEICCIMDLSRGDIEESAVQFVWK